MRIIIRNFNEIGSMLSQVINVDETQVVLELKKKIKEIFGIKIHQQLLWFKIDNMKKFITENSKVLSFYEIQQNQAIIVEKIKDSKKIAQRRQTTVDKIDIDHNNVHYNMRNQVVIKDFQTYEEEFEQFIQDQQQKLIQILQTTKYEELEESDQKEQLNEIVQILDQSHPERFHIDKDKFNEEMSNILNLPEKSTGWNVVHYAIFYGRLDLLEYFVEKNADFIQNTIGQNQTSLYIAVKQEHPEIVKFILNNDPEDINYLVDGNSVLHIACQLDNEQIVQILIDYNAIYDLENKDGLTPIELTTNKLIKNIIEHEEFNLKQHQYQSKQDNQLLNQQSLMRQDTMEPEIFDNNHLQCQGLLYKISKIFQRLVVRLFVINAYEGNFVRYKRDQYPLNPKSLHVKNFHKIGLLVTDKYVDESEPIQIVDEPGNNQIMMNNKVLFDIETIWDKTFNEIIAYERHEFCESDSDENDNDNSYDIQNQSFQSDQEKIQLNSFQIIKQLGSGAFGLVYLVVKKDDQKIYAMKALLKRQLIQKKKLNFIITEANILKTMDHPFILNLNYCFQTPQYVYFIMEYCQGGDLLYHLQKQITFSINDAKYYIAELILAIEHLHEKQILYRDLKPENILIDSEGHLKLTDFGLSKENVGPNDIAYSFCGSPAYLSPEAVAQKGCTYASDIYGIGAVLYEFLVGQPAFYTHDKDLMNENILSGNIEFPYGIDEDAQDFIKRTMCVDPEKRIGAFDKNELKNHPFFKNIDWKKIYNKEIDPPQVEMPDLFLDEDFEELKENPNLIQDFDYSAKNKNIARIKNLSFRKIDNQTEKSVSELEKILSNYESSKHSQSHLESIDQQYDLRLEEELQEENQYIQLKQDNSKFSSPKNNVSIDNQQSSPNTKNLSRKKSCSLQNLDKILYSNSDSKILDNKQQFENIENLTETQDSQSKSNHSSMAMMKKMDSIQEQD